MTHHCHTISNQAFSELTVRLLSCGAQRLISLSFPPTVTPSHMLTLLFQCFHQGSAPRWFGGLQHNMTAKFRTEDGSDYDDLGEDATATSWSGKRLRCTWSLTSKENGEPSTPSIKHGCFNNGLMSPPERSTSEPPSTRRRIRSKMPDPGIRMIRATRLLNGQGVPVVVNEDPVGRLEALQDPAIYTQIDEFDKDESRWR